MGEDADKPTEVLRFLVTVVPTVKAVTIADAMGVTKGTLSRWLGLREPMPIKRRRQALEVLREVMLAWKAADRRSSVDEKMILEGGRSGAARSIIATAILSAGNLLIEEEERRLNQLSLERSHEKDPA